MMHSTGFSGQVMKMKGFNKDAAGLVREQMT